MKHDMNRHLDVPRGHSRSSRKERTSWRRLMVLSGTLAGVLAPSRAWAGAPAITQQPAPVSVTAGGGANFSISDSSSCGTITNQWQFNGVNISDNSVYSGTQTGTLTITGAGAAQQGTYRIVLSCVNGGGVTISQPAMLTVNPTSYPAGLPPIPTGNVGWSGCSGGSCTVWWNAIPGATALTLTPGGGTPIDVTGLRQYTVSPTQSTIYTLTASNAFGTYGENVAVPYGPATAISSCGTTISTPGNYIISQNLTQTQAGSPCISVQNTSNVVIRCFANATVQGSGNGGDGGGAINVTNATNFAVSGCALQLNPSQPDTTVVTVTNSSMGVFVGNTFGSTSPPSGTVTQQVYVTSSHYITFWDNNIYNALAITGGNGFTIADNFFTTVTKLTEIPGNLVIQSGGGNQVIGNVINGGRGSTGSTDDGIIAASETGDLYADNGFENTADACLEWSGALVNSTIYNNSMQNCQFGISNWYGDAGNYGLSGSTIGSNQIYNMPGGTCPSASWMSSPTGFSFFYNGVHGGINNVWKNNLFSGNTVSNSSCAQPSQFTLNGYGTGWNGGVTYSWSVGNNEFTGNSFGTIAAPGGSAPQFWYNPSAQSYLLPAGGTKALGVIDGGGNTCNEPPANCNQPYGNGQSCTFETPYPTSGYPITCH